METFITVDDMATRLGCSVRRARQLLTEHRVVGARKFGPANRRGVWVIPVDDSGYPSVTATAATRGPKPGYKTLPKMLEG